MQGHQKRLLPVGTPAPDFRLQDAPKQFVALSDFRGQPVVLLFYGADFSPISSDEISVFNEVLPEFQRHEAQLLGISVDNVWSHLAFSQERNLHFPLLSDFHPKGETTLAYRAFIEDEGQAARAIYVLDYAGKIVWRYVSPPGVSPGADGALLAVEQLDSKHALSINS